MVTKMKQGSFVVVWVALLVSGIATSMLVPSVGHAQSADNVKKAMAVLEEKAAKLGPAEIRGEKSVAGKTVPVLFFGETKGDNNFTLVDEVQRETGGVETLFVKSGDEFVRVSTNIIKDDGSRAIGPLWIPRAR